MPWPMKRPTQAIYHYKAVSVACYAIVISAGRVCFPYRPFFHGCGHTCIEYRSRQLPSAPSQGVLVRFLRFSLGCNHLYPAISRFVYDVTQHVLTMRYNAFWSTLIVESQEKMHAAVPVAYAQHGNVCPVFGCVALGGLLSLPADMLHATVKLVAVCTRVAWFPHKSGGPKAHTYCQRFWSIQICI